MQKKVLEIQKDIESHYNTIKKVIKLPKKKTKEPLPSRNTTRATVY